MASMRFSEAGVLASERGTWNDNDIALLVKKDLEKKALGITLGLADSESSLNTVDASYKQHLKNLTIRLSVSRLHSHGSRATSRNTYMCE